MQRSYTQILYRYLPDAVFSHEEGFIAQVHSIHGNRVTNINTRVLLDEIAVEWEQWRPDQRGIPNPRTNPDEYVVIEPRQVIFDVFPLTFECKSRVCGRVRRWFNLREFIAAVDADGGHLACKVCKSKMRQLRYFTAHNCGNMKAMHTQVCPTCNTGDNMYLDDLGSFRSSTWRCRTCGFAIGTRFTPCSCGDYVGPSGRAYQTGFTERDGRLWYPQAITLLNISGPTYDSLQSHPMRGGIAIASWLGDQRNIATSLLEVDGGNAAPRMSAAEWEKTEQTLRTSGVDEATIDAMRTLRGPLVSGAGAVASTVSPELKALGESRGFVECAGLYDMLIIDDRKSFATISANATGAAAAAAASATRAMESLGIEDISVTQRFPILAASYGYSRSQRAPGAAHLKSYAKTKEYDGKTPIFAVPANTEALLVSLDAAKILEFLAREGLNPPMTVTDRRSARMAVAEVLAADPNRATDDAAGVVRRLVHSMSHAMLRALDDGESGFGESSLAEWIVPDALTFAVYVASYKDFTLGAFDTVLRRRISMWLEKAADDIAFCDNDPMCSHTTTHKPHAACDRCLHLSFGCKTWNADLDRKLLRRFWNWSQSVTTTI